jgi:putative inorganic carbon (HCO3(-)) transporter
LAVSLQDAAFDPRWEWLRVLALLPFLMFPGAAPRAAVAALLIWAILTIVAWRRGTALVVSTPFNTALVLFSVMAVVGVAITPFPSVALPKAAGLVLGLLAFRAIVLGTPTLRHVRRAVGVYLALGCGLVVNGAFATAWFEKVPLAFHLRLPRVVTHLPGTAPEGVQPNGLAGTILMLAPLALALLLPRTSGGGAGAPLSLAGRGPWVATAATGLALIMLLFATQSRTGWVALVATMAVLAAVRWRAARVAVLAIAGAATVGIALAWGPIGAAVRRIASTAGSLDISWAGRLELWQRAVSAISDFPVTGVGLNAFRQVVRTMYPLSIVPADLDVAHAHNVFLQTALDIGLPGLVAYLSLLMVATTLAWRVHRGTGRAEGILALGLWGNLLAVHLFGLADAIALGAKVGLLFWLTLGLIAALHRCAVASEAG